METMWLDVFEGVELILNLFTNSMESRAYCPTFNNFCDHGLHSYTYCLCLNLTLNICYFNFFLSLFIFELLDRTCTILYFVRSSDFLRFCWEIITFGGVFWVIFLTLAILIKTT